MATEAERKRLQRAGYSHWQVRVHPRTVAQALFDEGLITEAQLEDVDAQKEALSQFIARHCAVGRILREKKPPPPPRRVRRPYGGRRHQARHGPDRRYTPEEIAALNAQCDEDLLGDKYGPYLTPERKAAAEKLEREGSLGSEPFGVRGIHGVIDVSEPGGAYIEDLPPDWEKPRKHWRGPGWDEPLTWTWDDDEESAPDTDPMVFGELDQDALHGLDTMDSVPGEDHGGDDN